MTENPTWELTESPLYPLTDKPTSLSVIEHEQPGLKDYMPDLTVASAIEAQREAIATLRSLLANNPTAGIAKELSMASKRYSDMLVSLEIERRVDALTDETNDKP